jgi:AcrR family transcriptional regulator
MENEKPLGRRKIQGQETKARIYEAASILIREEGFDAVTVDRICARARVAKGSFYHHFRSKADIIVEGYSLCDRYFDEEVAGKLSAPDAAGRVVEFIGRQMQYAVDTGIDLMIQTYKSQLENGTKFFISAERSLPSILNALIAEGQASGEFRADLSADYLTEYILRFSRGMIYDWCLRSGGYDLVAVGEEACARLMGIFRAGASS